VVDRRQKVQREISSVEKDLHLRRAVSSRVGRLLIKKREEVGRVDGALQMQQREAGFTRQAMTRVFRTLYRQRPPELLEAITWPQATGQFKRYRHNLEQVAHRQTSRLSRLEAKSMSLTRQHQTVNVAIHQLVDKKHMAEREIHRLEGAVQKGHSDLDGLEQEQEAAQVAFIDLHQSAVNLEVLLKGLEAKKGPTHAGKFATVRGQLAWPTSGRVVSLFGRQKHPKFDTYVYRNGIQIAPSSDRTVHAVYAGKVVYAGPLRGYGEVVILDHGRGDYSVYGRLDPLHVALGDQVRENRPIGQVIDAGVENLYFEIRHQGRPEDPLVWLQKRAQAS